MSTHSMLFILFGAIFVTLETYVWAWRNGQTGKPRARFLALRQEANWPEPRQRPAMMRLVICGLLGVVVIWGALMMNVLIRTIHGG